MTTSSQNTKTQGVLKIQIPLPTIDCNQSNISPCKSSFLSISVLILERSQSVRFLLWVVTVCRTNRKYCVVLWNHERLVKCPRTKSKFLLHAENPNSFVCHVSRIILVIAKFNIMSRILLKSTRNSNIKSWSKSN